MKKKNRKRLCLGIALSALFVSAPAQRAATAGEEKPYGVIFGTVYGPDNRSVYGVNVKIRRASDKKAKWELISDHHGEFAQRVPATPQDYVVWADVKSKKGGKSGVKSAVPEEVTVHIGGQERKDISLHLRE